MRSFLVVTDQYTVIRNSPLEKEDQRNSHKMPRTEEFHKLALFSVVRFLYHMGETYHSVKINTFPLNG